MQKNTPSLKISEKDNLLVALKDLMPGQQVITDNESFNLTEKIPAKHKFAGQNFSTGDLAYMYGVLVGEATCPIQAGDRITIENLIHRSAEFSAGKGSKSWTSPSTTKWKNKTFLGYHRSDGSVGTANYWLVVPLVFCENGNIEILKRSMTKALGFNKRSQYESFAEELAKAYKNGDSPVNVQLPQENTNRPSPIFPNIDGVKFLTHGLGCGETRGVSNELCGLLAGYACNPNVAGITILSLGCQHAQVSIMEEEISKRCANFDKPFLVFEQQKYPSEREMLEKAIRQTFENLAEINKTGRTPAPLQNYALVWNVVHLTGFPEFLPTLALDKLPTSLLGWVDE